jgi:aldehyde dehydrogenase (NAD+)
VARALREAGLPEGVLTVTEESVEAAQRELELGTDKVIFTGSFESGRKVLSGLAETATPAVMELAGADAIMVTPEADLQRVAEAVAFGLRLNGGAVCMSPRRLFANPGTMKALRPLLEAELAKVPPITLDAKTETRLNQMLEEAVSAGATVRSAGVDTPPMTMKPSWMGHPILVDGARPSMAIAQSDVFAPVISLLEANSMLHAAELYAHCPFALTVAIFCAPQEEKRARMLAGMLRAGTVLFNDVIAPTVDPRVSFGGRGASGYGVTRGAEGLLEMTAVKTLLIRRGRSTLHMQPTQDADAPMFSGLIAAIHGNGWARRWRGLRRFLGGARAWK